MLYVKSRNNEISKKNYAFKIIIRENKYFEDFIITRLDTTSMATNRSRERYIPKVGRENEELGELAGEKWLIFQK